jgi:hypothetical protein
MELEASMSGTIRTIIILLIIWWVLRLLLRAGQKRRNVGTRWTDDPGRPKGDVRIERVREKERDKGKGPDGNVTDADFEELK